MRVKELIINQKSGAVNFGDVEVSFQSRLEDLLGELSPDLLLIYGKDGTAKYGLKNPVQTFGEAFRVYFRFENRRIQACVIELISVAEGQQDDYPGYKELQRELDYLFNLFQRELHGVLSSEYEWKKVWRYHWGQIVLVQDFKSSRVITDISWFSDSEKICAARC